MNIYSHEGLFLPNKYTRWYYNIIEKAQSQDRKKLKRDHPDFIYYEKHHILPKCIWPQYKNLRLHSWNGILLTAREHYICHAILIKMVENSTKNQYKLLCAYLKMNFSNDVHIRYTSKVYEYLKNKKSILQSKLYSGKNSPHYKKHLSEEHKRKISKTLIKNNYRGENSPNFGRKASINTKEKQKLIKLGKTLPPRNQEWCNNISKIQTGLLWWNNGIVMTKSKLCPGEGWERGQLPIKDDRASKMKGQNKGKFHWNNGIERKFQIECPGEGWIKGILKS